jgi:U4/U6 small nuclear ribonucleoprotein PRP31
MSSLADELLNEFDDIEEDNTPEADDDGFKIPSLPGPSSNKRKQPPTNGSDDEMSEGEGEEEDGKAGLVLEGGVKPAEELDEDDVKQMELGKVGDVRSVAKLEGSKRMNDILKVKSHCAVHYACNNLTWFENRK